MKRLSSSLFFSRIGKRCRSIQQQHIQRGEGSYITNRTLPLSTRSMHTSIVTCSSAVSSRSSIPPFNITLPQEELMNARQRLKRLELFLFHNLTTDSAAVVDAATTTGENQPQNASTIESTDLNQSISPSSTDVELALSKEASMGVKLLLESLFNNVKQYYKIQEVAREYNTMQFERLKSNLTDLSRLVSRETRASPISTCMYLIDLCDTLNLTDTANRLIQYVHKTYNTPLDYKSYQSMVSLFVRMNRLQDAWQFIQTCEHHGYLNLSKNLKHFNYCRVYLPLFMALTEHESKAKPKAPPVTVFSPPRVLLDSVRNHLLSRGVLRTLATLEMEERFRKQIEDAKRNPNLEYAAMKQLHEASHHLFSPEELKQANSYLYPDFDDPDFEKLWEGEDAPYEYEDDTPIDVLMPDEFEDDHFLPFQRAAAAAREREKNKDLPETN